MVKISEWAKTAVKKITFQKALGRLKNWMITKFSEDSRIGKLFKNIKNNAAERKATRKENKQLDRIFKKISKGKSGAAKTLTEEEKAFLKAKYIDYEKYEGGSNNE